MQGEYEYTNIMDLGEYRLGFGCRRRLLLPQDEEEEQEEEEEEEVKVEMEAEAERKRGLKTEKDGQTVVKEFVEEEAH